MNRKTGGFGLSIWAVVGDAAFVRNDGSLPLVTRNEEGFCFRGDHEVYS